MQLDYIAEIFSVSTWGSGVDLILDCVGGSYWEKNINCLSTDGRWIIYGLLSGGEVHGDLLARLLSKRASIHTSLLRSRDKEASNGYEQCIQFDLKINDSFESFLWIPVLKQNLTHHYPKKHHLELLLHTLENTAKLSYNFPFFIKCLPFRTTELEEWYLGLFNVLNQCHNLKIWPKKKQNSSDQAAWSSRGGGEGELLLDHFSR